MDNTKTEQQRLITMKSSSISLYFDHTRRGWCCLLVVVMVVTCQTNRELIQPIDQEPNTLFINKILFIALNCVTYDHFFLI